MIETLVAGVAAVLIGLGALFIWETWIPLAVIVSLYAGWLWVRRFLRLRRGGV